MRKFIPDVSLRKGDLARLLDVSAPHINTVVDPESGTEFPASLPDRSSGKPCGWKWSSRAVEKWIAKKATEPTDARNKIPASCRKIIEAGGVIPALRLVYPFDFAKRFDLDDGK